MKNLRVLLSDDFQFLEVKFSIYLNRRVFEMFSSVYMYPKWNKCSRWEKKSFLKSRHPFRKGSGVHRSQKDVTKVPVLQNDGKIPNVPSPLNLKCRYVLLVLIRDDISGMGLFLYNTAG